jgi:hypothetical protein
MSLPLVGPLVGESSQHLKVPTTTVVKTKVAEVLLSSIETEQLKMEMKFLSSIEICQTITVNLLLLNLSKA